MINYHRLAQASLIGHSSIQLSMYNSAYSESIPPAAYIPTTGLDPSHFYQNLVSKYSFITGILVCITNFSFHTSLNYNFPLRTEPVYERNCKHRIYHKSYKSLTEFWQNINTNIYRCVHNRMGILKSAKTKYRI